MGLEPTGVGNLYGRQAHSQGGNRGRGRSFSKVCFSRRGARRRRRVELREDRSGPFDHLHSIRRSDEGAWDANHVHTTGEPLPKRSLTVVLKNASPRDHHSSNERIRGKNWGSGCEGRARDFLPSQRRTTALGEAKEISHNSGCQKFWQAEAKRKR